MPRVTGTLLSGKMEQRRSSGRGQNQPGEEKHHWRYSSRFLSSEVFPCSITPSSIRSYRRPSEKQSGMREER